MNSPIKAVIPRPFLRILGYRRYIHLLLDSVHDWSRYGKYSSAVHHGYDQEKLRAIITALYHNIEKGLSLPNPRPGFGRENIIRLIEHMCMVTDKYGPQEYLLTPMGALDAYVTFNQTLGGLDPDLSERIASFQKRMSGIDKCEAMHGGVKLISRDTQLQSACTGLEFLMSRNTCRQFTQQPVSTELIEQSVRAAQYAPSVCNRQAGRIHVFSTRADIDRILSVQRGARGFGQNATVLFCVTVDLRAFGGSGERYQGWIDGGMFAMNLVLGLHSQGLGSCCLNWSKTHHDDKEMRNLIKLPDYESIIMFIAAGHTPDHYMAAKSVRRPLQEVLTYRTLNNSID